MSLITPKESSFDLPSSEGQFDKDMDPATTESALLDERASGWKAWQSYLQTRKRGQLPRGFKKKSPLVWGWPSGWERAAIKEAIGTPAVLAENVIADDASTPDLHLALQYVALAYVLPKLVDDLPAEIWWQLLDRLRDTATQAQAARLDWPGNPRDVVRHQLLAGELPLALSYLFPELPSIRNMRDDARAALSEALIELTDGQGLPDARLLEVLGPLFACWTRSRWIGSKLKRGAWSREAETQYRWLVRYAIRLADKNRRFVLTSSDAEKAWNEALFRRALKLIADPGDVTAAKAALPRRVTSRFAVDKSKRPAPSLNSDWAGITIMASGWSQRNPRVSLAYATNPMRIEVAANGRRFLSGFWQTETWCNGRVVEPTSDWEQLCFESGKRFDFLELGLRLSEGLRIERQIVFGRADRVLYFADVVASSDAAPRDIRHVVHFPLASGAEWWAEAETRDGLIVHKGIRAAVMPLALREWRSDPRAGSLCKDNDSLVLDQQVTGRALCCPLFIDLDCERTRYERTWRQLTVGENLEIVPADVAVAYRAQSADDQWLFYRSLGPVGNRTFMGQNTSGEFSVGRFDPYREKFKEWVEIEPVRNS